MKILITNDDGYDFQGIKSLVKIMRPYGELVIVAPKYHQSGMSMAVSMGLKPIAIKKLKEEPGEQWWYLDGTPASCVKWGLDEVFGPDNYPDLVISGINHGANAGSAVLYSGTLGAAQEGSLAGILSFGVSLDHMGHDADFSAVEEMFPKIFEKLYKNRSGKFGTFYNINFPDLPISEIKGIRPAYQGILHWEKEFRPYDFDIFRKWGVSPERLGINHYPEVEEGETIYMMAGEMVEDVRNDENTTDSLLLKQGYVTVSVHNIDSTDYQETERLCGII